MVSIEKTTRKYRGKYAADYVEVRAPQQRWNLENDHVRQLMSDLPRESTVLDVPCGTGRFFPLWRELGFRPTGVDISSDMLRQAQEHSWSESKILQSDILNLNCSAERYEAAVCVRFLDLIEEEAMRSVVKTLLALARDRVVLTIRLGETYVAKTNTATHDEKKFRALVSRAGWRVDQEIPVLRAGWRVMRLRPKTK